MVKKIEDQKWTLTLSYNEVMLLEQAVKDNIRDFHKSARKLKGNEDQAFLYGHISDCHHILDNIDWQMKNQPK